MTNNKFTKMKIYVLIHEANVEFKSPFAYEILSSYLSKEKAMEALAEIDSETENGTNPHLRGMNPTKITNDYGGLTYEWISDDEEKCYTHYKIKEVELKN